MKELFDRHQERMTDAEDRKVWQTLFDAAKGRRPFWKRWGVPVSALATVTAAVVVISVVSQERNPIVEVATAPDIPEVSVRGDADHRGAALEKGLGTEVAEVPETRALTPRREPARARNRLEPQPVAVEMLAANEEEADRKSAKGKEVMAASGTIRGRVTSDKGEPLSFANVVIRGTDLGAMTDSSGAFVIENVPHGVHTLSITYLGYETIEEEVRLQGDVNLAQNFEMDEKEVATMAGVVVESERDMHLRGGRSNEIAQRIERYKKEGNDQATKVRRQLRADRLSVAEPQAEAPASRSRSDAPAAAEAPGRTGGEVRSFVPSVTSGPGPQTTVGGTHAVNGKVFDDMFFEHYGVNPFVDPEDDRFATFAVDVDNASYSLTRSYLQRGVLPPKEAVRVEEFINSFPHGYAAPDHPLMARRDRWAPSEHGTFAIHLDAAPSPFGDDLVLVRVGLKGREVYAENRKPANLTFVVDVSGSMKRENRLGLVKEALFLLLDQMHAEDQVSLVVYGSNARTILHPTSLRDRSRIERAIAQLQAGGSTYAEAGLREGYRMAERAYREGCINRVILCSDGVANVGQTGADAILKVIRQQAGEGIYLTAVGFGMGNYNDVLMEKLANKGEGNYYYVDRIGEAKKVFVENLTGTLQTIARQMKTQVEFDPDTVRRYRLIGYENRDVADKDFRNDKVDAGEVGAGHEVTALFELKLEKDAPRRGNLATVRIRYEDPDTKRVTEESRVLRTEDIQRRFSKSDPTFRMDAAVAEFAEILRHSYWAKDGDLKKVLGLARDASRELGRPAELEEMVQLVEQAWRLWPANDTGEWKVRPDWDPDEDGE